MFNNKFYLRAKDIIANKIYICDNKKGFKDFIYELDTPYRFPREHGGALEYTYKNKYTRKEVIKILNDRIKEKASTN